MNAARMYTLPFVKIMLKGIIMPFRKYLECLGMITGVSVDYANAFEWMALKRFQEIFSLGENRRPADALPLNPDLWQLPRNILFYYTINAKDYGKRKSYFFSSISHCPS